MFTLIGKLRKDLCNAKDIDKALSLMQKHVVLLKKHVRFFYSIFENIGESVYFNPDIDEMKHLRKIMDIYTEIIGEYYKSYSNHNINRLCDYLRDKEKEVEELKEYAEKMITKYLRYDKSLRKVVGNINDNRDIIDILNLLAILRRQICNIKEMKQALKTIHKHYLILKEHHRLFRDMFRRWSDKYHIFFETDEIKEMKKILEIYEEAIGEYYKAYSIVSDGGNLNRLCNFLKDKENDINYDLAKEAIKTMGSIHSDIWKRIKELERFEKEIVF